MTATGIPSQGPACKPLREHDQMMHNPETLSTAHAAAHRKRDDFQAIAC